jgi:ABC-type sugar transport system permease subunit
MLNDGIGAYVPNNAIFVTERNMQARLMWTTGPLPSADVSGCAARNGAGKILGYRLYRVACQMTRNKRTRTSRGAPFRTRRAVRHMQSHHNQQRQSISTPPVPSPPCSFCVSPSRGSNQPTRLHTWTDINKEAFTQKRNQTLHWLLSFKTTSDLLEIITFLRCLYFAEKGQQVFKAIILSLCIREVSVSSLFWYIQFLDQLFRGILQFLHEDFGMAQQTRPLPYPSRSFPINPLLINLNYSL